MELVEIIKDSSRLFIGDEVGQDYLFDEYVGQAKSVHAVALPLTHEEVVALVKYANEKDLKIIARGAGTGLSGATAPLENELIIDLSKMNKIIDLDLNTMTLTVEPGVQLHEIQEYVESRGFFYPPDPGSKNSTIGGNVATNAGGMRAVKYGVTRDYVRTIRLVLADGRELTVGTLNVKSSSGYDIKDLFIGSEGTLGISTLIQLKVIPLPKVKKSYIIAFDNLLEATRCVNTILHSGIAPTALEFFERDMIQLSEKETGLAFPTKKGHSFLLATFDGDDASFIDQRAGVLKEIADKHEAEDYIILEGQSEKDAWKLRDTLLTAVVNYTEQVTMDETVPIHHIATIYEYTKELEAKYGLKLMSFGHAGDGNLHTCVLRGDIESDSEWHETLEIVLNLLYNKIQELGGLPSAEHGIGIIKKKYFGKMMDPVYLDLMSSIKTSFDPTNRLNPGKLVI